MSDCREVFARLSEYLDHELPDADCAEIQAHIEKCPPCVEFVKSLKKAMELCHQYSASDLPSPLTDDARRRLLEIYRDSIVSPETPPRQDPGGPRYSVAKLGL